MTDTKRPTRREVRERDARRRLADPGTYAAMDRAMEEARAAFGPRLTAAAAKITSAPDAVAKMAAVAEFNAISIEQKLFAEAALRRRLDPDRDGA